MVGEDTKFASFLVRDNGGKTDGQFRCKLAAVLPSPGSKALTKCTPAAGVVANVFCLATQYQERGGQHQFGAERNISLMLAILSDYRGVAAYRPYPGNAQVKFVILSHGKVSIEPTQLIENAAAE